MTPASDKTQTGFTLVELVLVMTIMTILGLFAAMMISNIHDRAKETRTQATMKLIEEALDMYREEIGHYPLGDATNMVSVLTEPTSGWQNAGLSKWFPDHEEVKDAWGMAFYYTCHPEYESSGRAVERTPKMQDYYNPGRFQLYSLGANMRTWPETQAAGGHPRLCGTEEDDIRNWHHEDFHIPDAYL